MNRLTLLHPVVALVLTALVPRFGVAEVPQVAGPGSAAPMSSNDTHSNAVRDLGLGNRVIVAQVIEDTLDWRGYYPLAVGNEWQFTVTHWPVPVQNHERFRVVGDTTVDGEQRFLVDRHVTELDGNPAEDHPFMMWYDSTGTIGGNRFQNVQGGIDLRTSFGDSVRTDGSPLGDYVVVGGHYEAEVTIGPATYEVPAAKEADGLYAWGIGPINHVAWDGPSYSLSYARVGGVEYGAPVITTSTHPGPSARTGLRAGQPYPNPSTGSVFVDVHLDDAAALDLRVMDSLGRIVWRSTEPARAPGSHRLPLDLRALAAGTYFVQILSGDGHHSVIPVTLIP